MDASRDRARSTRTHDRGTRHFQLSVDGSLREGSWLRLRHRMQSSPCTRTPMRLSIALLLCIATAPVDGQERLSGSWQGYWWRAGDSMPVALDVTEALEQHEADLFASGRRPPSAARSAGAGARRSDRSRGPGAPRGAGGRRRRPHNEQGSRRQDPRRAGAGPGRPRRVPAQDHARRDRHRHGHRDGQQRARHGHRHQHRDGDVHGHALLALAEGHGRVLRDGRPQASALPSRIPVDKRGSATGC